MSTFPASQMIVGGVFLLCAATTVAGALIAALTARIIRSVCGLMICCLGLAGLYYFLHSPFLALMEILIYVGAVCVTIIFAVMLAEPEESVQDDKRASAVLWGGFAFLICAAIFWPDWREPSFTRRPSRPWKRSAPPYPPHCLPAPTPQPISRASAPGSSSMPSRTASSSSPWPEDRNSSSEAAAPLAM